MLALVIGFVACGPATRSEKPGAATDEWVRTYTLKAGGNVAIVNRHGAVRVDAMDGNRVEVRVVRGATATSEAAARDLLTRIGIEEIAAEDRIALTTTGVAGLLVGVSFETAYHVTVPPWAAIRVQTANGDIAVKGLRRRFTAASGSGSISGEDLGGAVDVTTGMGRVLIDLSTVRDPVTLRTGRRGRGRGRDAGGHGDAAIELSIPSNVDATLSASATGGQVSFVGLQFEAFGDPGIRRQRRVQGRINAGGVPVEISSAGDVVVRARVEPPTRP